MCFIDEIVRFQSKNANIQMATILTITIWHFLAIRPAIAQSKTINFVLLDTPDVQKGPVGSYNAGQKLWQKPENPAKIYTTQSIFLAFRIMLPPNINVEITAHWLAIALKTTLKLGEGEILNKHL